jgi:ABC-type nitrate/sulfonate/bicarbonate transport system permease component
MQSTVNPAAAPGRPGAAEGARPRARRPRLSSLSRRRQRLVVWGGLLIAWQVFGMIVGPFFFASVTDTIRGLVEIVSDGALVTLLKSFEQLLIGYALAVAVGIPAGIYIGSSWVGEATLGVYVRALFVTSLEALLPFLIILVGSSLQFRVVVVFLFAVLYITINTTAGVRDVDRGFLETARSFGASRLEMARKVVLPAAVPFVFSGLRLGWGFAVKGMVIAELWVATGTGKLLIDLGGTRQLDRYFAIALLIVVVGAVGSSLIRLAQRAVAPWAAIAHGVRGLD